ncbi:glycosyltransferase [Ornithinimicrobium sp. Arc0846-15]|nr:glycosyltransferase [Ornithinimicrobium laminariae]
MAMFEGLGLDVEVISVYQGHGQSDFKPLVVIKRRALHRGPSFRGSSRFAWKLWLLPLVAFKRVDWTWAMARYRSRMSSFDSGTLVVFTHVLPLRLLTGAGFRWRGDRPLIFGQHHSPFSSVEDDESMRSALVEEFSNVDTFIALTETDTRRFSSILPTKCETIPNPVMDLKESTLMEYKSEFRLAVALARLSGEKQLALMIRAFASAVDIPSLRNWKLEIYGDGEERAELLRLINELGIGKRVELMGVVDDVGPVLAKASVILNSSLYEGMPLSVLEAAQRAVPTMAFACSPGMIELVTKLHGRLVYPSSSENAFAMALREQLGDEPGLRESGRLAQLAVRCYSHTLVAKEWARVVADAAARRPQ